MATTPHLNITLLSSSQAQKEVTINLALQVLEALQNTGVVSMALATPPGSPSEGSLYVVASSPTGAWSGMAGKFAYYINASWIFIAPANGVTFWDRNTSAFYVYNGSTFQSLIAGANPSFSTLGINATPDSTNKLSVASSAVLFNHIGNGTQCKINKNASADTNSFVFQTGFSGRSEFGCVGDDNFQLKVSSDGSTWYQSWVIDKSSGNCNFKQNIEAEKLLTVSQFLSLPLASTLTIVSGSVTATKSHHKIDTEGGAGTDDLDNILGGTGNSILLLEPANSGRTVVIRNNGGGTGNIRNKNGSSVSLSGYGSNWLGFWDGSNWLQIS